MKCLSSVVVTSRSFSTHPVLREELLKSYANVTFNDSGESLQGETLIEFLRGHERAITALETLDEKVFSSLPELKIVSKFGVGLDMIDIDAMSRHGVLLGWTGGVNRRSVAEMVVSAAISLLHRVPEAMSEIRSGTFRQIRGRQLSGRTIGIIGCGHIGKELAVLLKAFNCSVLAHDILDFPEFYQANLHVSPIGLDDLLKNSDVVTLHLPLDHSTLNILNADRLKLMKDGSILINMARGKLVDEQALKKLLKQERLAGVALDVFSLEPPTDTELLALPTVMATPHIGGSTEEAVLAMGLVAISGLSSAAPPFDTLKPGNDGG